MNLRKDEMIASVYDHIICLLDAARDISIGSKLHKRPEMVPYYRIASEMTPEQFNNMHQYVMTYSDESRLQWLTDLRTEYTRRVPVSALGSNNNRGKRDHENIYGGAKTSLTVEQQTIMKGLLDEEIVGEDRLRTLMARLGHELSRHQCRSFITQYKKHTGGA